MRDGGPALWGLPPGAEFPTAVAAGLLRRAEGRPPETLARVTVYLASARMRRQVRAAFDRGPDCLLPRLRLVQEIGADPLAGLPPPVPPLRRRLDLARLVARLIDLDPRLAPRGAVHALAESLAALLDEIHEEGASPAAIRDIDVTDLSGHWERSRTFLSLVQDYLTADPTRAPDPGERQRRAVDRLVADWAAAPPPHPVVIAGSTGSRGTTLDLIRAVAALPDGTVILPGFDFDLPPSVWERLARDAPGEDHPQSRHARLLSALGLDPGDVARWPDADPPAPARNRLVSLALRPAPVTDQWLRDGPALGCLADPTRRMTLIEAPHPRAEALAVALILRDAAERGTRAALITPDRELARRVTACLDRWDIVPDDSAGPPLGQTPPGRLLRQVSALLGRPPAPDTLLALLKHPLVHAGGDRNRHLLRTRRLEHILRDAGTPHPGRALLLEAFDSGDDRLWADWIAGILDDLPGPGTHSLAALAAVHVALAQRLAAGPAGDPAPLWDQAAGRAARALVDTLLREAGQGGDLDPDDYDALFRSLVEAEEVRNPDPSHPDIAILGTLEARVQEARLVILGGLNDGVWPTLPGPDPWLNRRMRAAAGLRLPDRRIGLSAHDFQQAIAAPEVVLTRTLRDNDAEPVPSRWLSRLTNLLGGLPATGGPEALAAMKERGAAWLALARALGTPAAPVPAAPRPSPRPPAETRPRSLSVTQVERLIRDPYAIYARHILRLKPLGPLRPEADAMLRGRILHDLFDGFMRDFDAIAPEHRSADLIARAEAILAERVAWPEARRFWAARVARLADWFVETEAELPSRFETSEVEGRLVTASGFTLKARADRIDRLADGGLALLDYKTGKPPSATEMESFSVQLLLEALIAEAGGFAGVAPAPVGHVGYIGLGTQPERSLFPLVETDKTDFRPEVIRARLDRLVAAYAGEDKGYTARRDVAGKRFGGDYDHLARYGEWDDTDAPRSEPVGGSG